MEKLWAGKGPGLVGTCGLNLKNIFGLGKLDGCFCGMMDGAAPVPLLRMTNKFAG